MVRKCVFKFCVNYLDLRDDASDKSRTWSHRLPNKEPRRSRWIRAIIAGLQTCGHEFDRSILNLQAPRICSAHFRPEDYGTTELGTRTLLRDAVPSVFNFEAPLPFATSTTKATKAKGSENRPRPSRTAQMARPAAKRPVSSGARTCKAIQSGNPGLQPTARLVPPPGATEYCRLCFTNQELEPLCSGVIVVRDELLEKIYVSTGVLIIARPKESIYICSPCAALINNFSTFRQQICSNNRALLDHLKGKNAPEIFDPTEPMISQPPLVGTAVSSVLSQAHIVRGPTPKRVILTPVGKTAPIRANTPILVRAPQPVQQVGTPRLPTLTRAPQTPVVVKRIVYTKDAPPPVKRIVYTNSGPTPDEAAMDIPEEIKTEYDDPLEGMGDSGNALIMPKPLKTTDGAPPPTTLKMRVESHPEPTVSGEESWKCWHCEQSFPFKFECAKHLLQAHREVVATISSRLELDELNSNMLEMMSLRGGGRPPPVKRVRVDSGGSSDVELCE